MLPSEVHVRPPHPLFLLAGISLTWDVGNPETIHMFDTRTDRVVTSVAASAVTLVPR